MFKRSDSLEKLDPAIWEQIVNENKRQEEHIELIASENTHYQPSWKHKAHSSRINMLRDI
jgi:glycine/serine hydroxymethyltransferase